MHRTMARSFAYVLGFLHLIALLVWTGSFYFAFTFSEAYEIPKWAVVLGHLVALSLYVLMAGLASTLISMNQNLERIANATGSGPSRKHGSLVIRADSSGITAFPTPPGGGSPNRPRSSGLRAEPAFRPR